MNFIYAQKSSTVPKAAAPNVSSVLDSSAQSESLQRKADMTNNVAQRAEAKRPNNTGMPDNLKSGIESLSGFSMDNVRVHYNSSKPATVQALAYTQGTDIHVAPGQEKCLPHEAWHVAQQMAGRVSPTTSINGMLVNDNAALEHEADVMGEKAVQCKTEKKDNSLMCKNELSSLPPVQMIREEKFMQNPEKFMRENIVLCDYSLGLQKRMKWDQFAAADFCACMNEGLFDKHYFVLIPFEVGKQTVYILTPAVEKYDLKRVENATGQKFRLKNIINDHTCLDKIHSLKSKSYIEACYVPYKHGSTANAEKDIGHVKVKKKTDISGSQDWNPHFVFTDVMNGCALVTTESENENWYSIWHYQSPGDHIENSSLFRRERCVVDWFGDDEYDPGIHSSNDYQTTVFMWRNGDRWVICSQNNDVISDTLGKSKKMDKIFVKRVVSRELSSSMDSAAQKVKIKNIYLNRMWYLLKNAKDWYALNQIENQYVRMLYDKYFKEFEFAVSELRKGNCDLKIMERAFLNLCLVYEKERDDYKAEEGGNGFERLSNLERLFTGYKKILETWIGELEAVSKSETCESAVNSR